MKQSTVRISVESHDVLRELARKLDLPIREVLERAIEAYRRERFLEEANEAFAQLRQRPGSMEEESEERRSFAGTLADDQERG